MKSVKDKARAIYDCWHSGLDKIAQNKCMTELKALLPEEDPSGETPYIYGLFVYDRECEENGDTDKALPYFLEALDKNGKHYMAHLYAGHCHHDKDRLKEALQEYDSVDLQRLHSDYPLWRYVKLQEQKGECL